jgi:hypothetical protein
VPRYGKEKACNVPHVVQGNLLRAADLESASAASLITGGNEGNSRKEEVPERRKTRTVPHVVQANLLRAADLESASAASPTTGENEGNSRKEEVPRKEKSSYGAPWRPGQSPAGSGPGISFSSESNHRLK